MSDSEAWDMGFDRGWDAAIESAYTAVAGVLGTVPETATLLEEIKQKFVDDLSMGETK